MKLFSVSFYHFTIATCCAILYAPFLPVRLFLGEKKGNLFCSGMGGIDPLFYSDGHLWNLKNRNSNPAQGTSALQAEQALWGYNHSESLFHSKNMDLLLYDFRKTAWKNETRVKQHSKACLSLWLFQNSVIKRCDRPRMFLWPTTNYSHGFIFLFGGSRTGCCKTFSCC